MVFGGPSGIVVGSVVSVVVDSARRERERLTSGKSLYVASFDEKYLRRVAGNFLRSANNPLCNRLRNLRSPMSGSTAGFCFILVF